MANNFVSQTANLVGSLITNYSLAGKIMASGNLTGSLSMPIGYEDYFGDYIVIPKVEAQSIPTKDKRMIDDVVVEAIPYAVVTNNAGGTTATIG